MKKVLVLVAIGLLVSTAAFAQITGSAHDFSTAGWGTTEICQACHTPHNADPYATNNTEAPLWNRSTPSSAGSYTLYNTSTLDMTISQPGGRSILCLSCHDGVAALDTFGGATGSTPMTGGINANLGTDLSDDHPVSVNYDPALDANNGFNAITGAGAQGANIGGLPLFGASFDLLECATCHDVHNNGAGLFMLRSDNDASALCLTCHNK